MSISVFPLSNLVCFVIVKDLKQEIEALKEEIEPLLMDKIFSRVFEELSNDQRKEIMRLFDAKKEAEALSKIEQMIPDYDNFLEEVFQEFAEEYLRTVK
jgi:Mg/Co/Ni transporter MgtE